MIVGTREAKFSLEDSRQERKKQLLLEVNFVKYIAAAIQHWQKITFEQHEATLLNVTSKSRSCLPQTPLLKY